MVITDLKTKLDNEFKKYYDVVLINGAWGIGKTYYLNNYLKEQKHIYLSLFGLNSMEEIKNGLYFQLNKSLSNFKKALKSFSGNNIGITIVSIPIPNFKFDIEKAIKKELKNDNIILVIDDLERKSENISIRELLGFIETLSQINGIKILLIANEEAIPNEEKNVFELFKEKVVNKTYNVYKYSSDAVLEISNKLLDDNPIDNIIDKTSFMEVITEVLSTHQIKNLRTLSKAILFSKIILEKVNDKVLILNDKKEIIKVSFAVVIENTDGLYFLSNKDEDMDYCILKNYFKTNAFDGNKLGIIRPIIELYFDRNIEINILNIKDYYFVKHNVNPEEKNIFYCDEQEVEHRLRNYVENSIKTINQETDVSVWFKELNNLYPWAEKINKPEIFEEVDIVSAIEEYVKKINTDDAIYDLIERVEPFELSNKKMAEYYIILKQKIAIYYFNEQIKKIQKSMHENKYNYKLLSDLFDNLRNTNIVAEETKNEVLDLIIKNDFFVPNINGEISDKQWHWCHIIWKNISIMEEKIKEELHQFTIKLIKKYTVIGSYRINSLNKQYQIVEKQSE